MCSQVQLFVYSQEHHKYILPYPVVPAIQAKNLIFLYLEVQLCTHEYITVQSILYHSDK